MANMNDERTQNQSPSQENSIKGGQHSTSGNKGTGQQSASNEHQPGQQGSARNEEKSGERSRTSGNR